MHRWQRTVLALSPLLALIALLAFLGFGLGRDPSIVPSPVIGKAMPFFEQVRLDQASRQIRSSDWLGAPALVNVWASWCLACRDEHSLLMAWAADASYPIYGINYKDRASDALRWLEHFGNPYQSIVHDERGRVGLDWGVYGVPETFVIDDQGIILHKHVGPLNGEVLEETIRPLLERARQKRRSA